MLFCHNLVNTSCTWRCSIFSHKKKADEDSGGSAAIHLQQFAPLQHRRALTDEEHADVHRGERQWLPSIFQSYATPLPSMLASPWKQGLLAGMAGAGVGGLAGGSIGASATSSPTGAGLGALIGALGLGGTAGLVTGLSRSAKNEGIIEMMKRLPENAVKRDLLSDPAYQADLHREHEGDNMNQFLRMMSPDSLLSPGKPLNLTMGKYSMFEAIGAKAATFGPLGCITPGCTEGNPCESCLKEQEDEKQATVKRACYPGCTKAKPCKSCRTKKAAATVQSTLSIFEIIGYAAAEKQAGIGSFAKGLLARGNKPMGRLGSAVGLGAATGAAGYAGTKVPELTDAWSGMFTGDTRGPGLDQAIGARQNLMKAQDAWDKLKPKGSFPAPAAPAAAPAVPAEPAPVKNDNPFGVDLAPGKAVPGKPPLSYAQRLSDYNRAHGDPFGVNNPDGLMGDPFAGSKPQEGGDLWSHVKENPWLYGLGALAAGGGLYAGYKALTQHDERERQQQGMIPYQPQQQQTSQYPPPYLINMR